MSATASAYLGLAWIVLISVVAMVPYPRHRPYALAMLLVLPVLLVAIIRDYGWLWGAALFCAALSIYRIPAWYLARRILRKLGLDT